MFQKVDFPALQEAVILDREELESKTRLHFAEVILVDRIMCKVMTDKEERQSSVEAARRGCAYGSRVTSEQPL